MLTQRIKLHGNALDASALEVASAAIVNGSVIAAPTETFYALCADPFNLHAVDQIFLIKGRQDWKPLLMLADSVDQVETIAHDIPDLFYEIAERFWPGPLTIILPAASKVPRKVTGGTGTVGVRIPDSPFTRFLVEAVDIPLIGTSANLSGHAPCSTADGVLHQLGGKIELVLDCGDTGGTVPSTILDLSREPAQIVREGAVPREELSVYLSQ